MSEETVAVLQPDMEILELHAPIAGKRIFDAGAEGAADGGLACRADVAIAEIVARIRNASIGETPGLRAREARIGDSEAARQVEQGVICRIADAPAKLANQSW